MKKEQPTVQPPAKTPTASKTGFFKSQRVRWLLIGWLAASLTFATMEYLYWETQQELQLQREERQIWKEQQKLRQQEWKNRKEQEQQRLQGELEKLQEEQEKMQEDQQRIQEEQERIQAEQERLNAMSYYSFRF